ncbi:EF-hand domain-containing protein [Candidatus Synechococcus calcipolaris G9]|uniref:EF-hand domain-containing protein n=1 Tax=Candidatus Synechococcus calcipolaris G9 TaxID=1497997 RepID=A0ABT6F1U7_9SYNE|nr:EF-hand domain-containing protein [Candidatus Synechococcus calcipolaris]MDG2991790.1 EF-hand domain-containing protein [Candidatus Synechococcus calcipolaris G9]
MLSQNLTDRLLRLFRFMDRNRDGVIEYEADLVAIAQKIAQRKFPDTTPDYQGLFELLAKTYSWENSRRDINRDGKVTPDEFLEGHQKLAKQMTASPTQGIEFIAKAAGGFFDVLDLDGDGYLSLEDVQDYANAYEKGGDWVAANFRSLIAEGLPENASDEMIDRGMSKSQFLELVRQFWFEPDESLPGSRLFGRAAETNW